MWRKLHIAVLGAVLAVPMLGLQSASALTISPVIIEQEADPGETFVGTIRIHNETANAETYYPIVRDFTASDEAGTPQFLENEGARSIVSWVDFNRSAITVDSGDGELLVYTVHVPKGAAPGGYFGGLLLSTSPNTADQGVGAVGATGPLLLIRVSGNLKEKGSVTDFGVKQDSSTSLPVNFGVRFDNAGNVQVKPQGFIRITNMFGGTSAVLPVNEQGGNVLPDSSRVFQADWSKASLPENASELAKEWNNFAFGPYTATLILNYGEGKQVASATQSFWVMPWMLIILFVILIVVIALLLMQYNKWVVARAVAGSRKR